MERKKTERESARSNRLTYRQAEGRRKNVEEEVETATSWKRKWKEMPKESDTTTTEKIMSMLLGKVRRVGCEGVGVKERGEELEKKFV